MANEAVVVTYEEVARIVKRLTELEKENEQLKEETARQSKRIIELLSYIGEA